MLIFLDVERLLRHRIIFSKVLYINGVVVSIKSFTGIDKASYAQHRVAYLSFQRVLNISNISEMSISLCTMDPLEGQEYKSA